MNSTLKKVSISLLAIILLAVLSYTIFRINAPNADEKLIEKTYNEQLNAILFSINQYSEDVMSKWASQMDTLMVTSLKNKENKIRPFLSENSSIKLVFFSDSTFSKLRVSSIRTDSTTTQMLDSQLQSILAAHKEQVNKLYQYRKSGYRKIEPAIQNSSLPDSLSLLTFLLNESDHPMQICGMLINTDMFINDILGPKIQSISQDKFILNVGRKTNNELVYSNLEGEAIDHKLQSNELWLFPDYYLSISLRGQSIEKLAEQRFNTYLYIILGLNFLLLLGGFFVFRNIRKEVKLAKIKSDFVSNVSHEIKTPLALINMFVETLQMGRVNSEEKKQEYYNILSQETDRLTNMVNKILNFSQVEAGKRKYTLESTDMNSIVNKVMQAYDFHLHHQGFLFSFEPGQDLLQIDADQEAVSEAVINLLENAVKYSAKVKEIRVKTGMKDGFTYVEISDKGIGIAPKDHQAVFDKFYRITHGDVHNTKGTGLGLSLVKHIVEAHRGHIELVSNRGIGSTFRLCFPGKYSVNKLLQVQ